MKLGMTIPGIHPLGSSVPLIELSQAAGCDTLWLPDHLQGAFHPVLWAESSGAALAADFDAFLDPWIISGVFGQQWEGPIGLSVTDSTRRKAADVARSALTLHHITKGGFYLGIGSGEAMNLTPYGYDFSSPVGILEDFLIELQALLTTGKMPDGLPGRMGIPLQREDGTGPQVWIAGHGARMLRLTGQYADGWLPAWPMSPALYAEKRQAIAAHAGTAGRPAPEAGLLIFLMLGQSRGQVADLLEKEPLAKLWALNASAATWKAHGYEHPLGPSTQGYIDVVVHDHDADYLRQVAPTIPLEVLEEVMFIGNPSEVLERLSGYGEAGLEHLVIANLTGIAGGMPQIEATIPDFLALSADIKAL